MKQRGREYGQEPTLLVCSPLELRSGSWTQYRLSSRNTRRKGGGKLKRMVKMLPITEIL